jgi:hypothetical protein
VEIPDVSGWSHQFDASSAECLIFVTKEGILSTVAHDLRVQIDEFEVAVDAPTRAVAAIFNADSLRVVTAMKDGKDDPGALSAEQKTQIELNIRLDVLNSREFPDIVFVSESTTDSEAGFVLKGELKIKEQVQTIFFPVRQADGCYVAEAKVHQPDFGIEPYSTMMGAIRVRPTVVVRVAIPAP